MKFFTWSNPVLDIVVESNNGGEMKRLNQTAAGIWHLMDRVMGILIFVQFVSQ